MKRFIQKYTKIGRKIASIVILLTFFVSSILPPSNIYAQQIGLSTILNLPVPGTMLPISAGFTPTLIKGINLHADNPLLFDFVIDTGDSDLEGEDLEAESEKLIKYFLASLTVPEKEMWVNLSPYEQDRIIPRDFGYTEMGRDLLAQDYMLKQLTASLMYPEKEIGENFWDRVYEKAQEKFGTTEIPINTFNKVWIVPEDAVVFEHDGGAVVLESRLKVMLEEDYLALERNLNSEKFGTDQLENKDVEILSSVSSEVVRDILIPEIEREVNEGESFAQLRQVYNSMVLATWYKQNLKESLLGQVYVDQNKTKGIDLEDKQINKKIYDQYVEAFKKGVYNFTREDFDPATQQIIPRKYFSGGYSQENPVKGFLSDIVASSALGVSRVEKLTVKDFIELAGTPGVEDNPEILEAMRAKVRTFTPGNQRKILAALSGGRKRSLKVVQSLFLEDTNGDEVLSAIQKVSSPLSDSQKRMEKIVNDVLKREGISLKKDINEIRDTDQAFILIKLFRETKDVSAKMLLKEEFKKLFEEEKDKIVLRRQKQMMFLFLLSRVELNLETETEGFKEDILWAGEYLLKNLSEMDEYIDEKIHFLSGVFLRFNFSEELQNIKSQIRDAFVKEQLGKSILSFDKTINLNLRRYWMNPLLKEMDVKWFEYRKREEFFSLTRGVVEEKFSSYLRSVVINERADDFLNKLKEGKIEPQTLVIFWTFGENGEKKIVQKAIISPTHTLWDLLYKPLVSEFSPETMVSYETVPNISYNPVQEITIEYFPDKREVVLTSNEKGPGKEEALQSYKEGEYNIVFSGSQEKINGKDVVFRFALRPESTRIEDVHAFFVLFSFGIGPEIFNWGETQNQYYYEAVEEIKGPTLAEYSRELNDQEIQEILGILTVLIQNGIHVEDAFRNPANIIIGKSSNNDKERAYIIDPGGLRIRGESSYEFLASEYRHEMASGGYLDHWNKIDPSSKIDSYLRQVQEQGRDALMKIEYTDSKESSAPLQQVNQRVVNQVVQYFQALEEGVDIEQFIGKSSEVQWNTLADKEAAYVEKKTDGVGGYRIIFSSSEKDNNELVLAREIFRTALEEFQRSIREEDEFVDGDQATKEFYRRLLEYVAVNQKGNPLGGKAAAYLNQLDEGGSAGSVISKEQEIWHQGGINLDPNLLNLQIKRDGNGVPLPVWEQPIDQMNIEGFLPVIINIQTVPVNNLPLLLGLSDEDEPLDNEVEHISFRTSPLWFIKKQEIDLKLT